jgi:hypothetical protein
MSSQALGNQYLIFGVPNAPRVVPWCDGVLADNSSAITVSAFGCQLTPTGILQHSPSGIISSLLGVMRAAGSFCAIPLVDPCPVSPLVNSPIISHNTILLGWLCSETLPLLVPVPVAIL